jgi:hypothetical protein
VGGRCFGDTRDLFKFDLVRHIMKSLPELDRFVFVPMLTGTESESLRKNGMGRDLKRAYRSGNAGSQNQRLREHMERLQEINNAPEYIDGVNSYFDNESIPVDIPGRQQFTNDGRTAYFRSVSGKFPAKSLIFIDPETGLTGGSPDCKHLLYAEIQKAAQRMDTGSVLMLYQHLPKKKRGDAIPVIGTRLEECAGAWPAVIADNDKVFFLLAKNQRLAARLEESLECYADTYPAVEYMSCE